MSILDKMQFRALDENFDVISLVDNYDSMIWTERYSDIGDFEIHGQANPQLALITGASYIYNSATSSLMVVEKPAIGLSEEDGSTITVSGRSFESFLDRRVMLESLTVFNPTSLSAGIFHDSRISQIICDLVSDAFALSDPTSKRYWSGLEVINDAVALLPKLQPDAGLQFTLGDNLLATVTNLCVAAGLGFKCKFSPADKKVQFIVYEGVNRTLQGKDLVVFSDLYDNLLAATDEAVFNNVKNTMLVVGNKVDPVTQIPLLPIVIGDTRWTGLARRETYFKANQDAVVFTSETVSRPMNNEEYVAALTLAGTTELNNVAYQSYKNFNGEILETPRCMYGTNFNLGDVVVFRILQTEETTARLDGVTFSDDAATGKTLVPKFVYGV